MPDHASPQPSPRIRPWLVVVAALAVLLPAGWATAVTTALDVPATAGRPAARIPAVRSAGLRFPIAAVPMCEFLNNFGGYSKVNGGGGHQGVDIGATEGQDVYAVERGVVTLVDLDPAGAEGISVRFVSDTDVQYRYYHLSAVADGLAVGQRVSDGEVLGGVGDTGNATPGGHHLHFEVRPGAPYRTPVNPASLLAIPTSCRIYGTVTPVSTTTTSTTTTSTTTTSTTTVPGT